MHTKRHAISGDRRRRPNAVCPQPGAVGLADEGRHRLGRSQDNVPQQIKRSLLLMATTPAQFSQQANDARAPAAVRGVDAARFLVCRTEYFIFAPPPKSCLV